MTSPKDEGKHSPGFVESLVEEAGVGSLYLSGDGQGLEILHDEKAVRLNRPGKGSGFDTSHLTRYSGTDFVQWHGRRADGRFYPWGKILMLTPQGLSALSKARSETT